MTQPELLAEIVRQVEDHAIIAIDRQGTIIAWNAGAERLKGYSEAEALGRSFAMFYTDADRRAGLPAALLREAAEAGHVQRQGWRVRRDGTRFWGDVAITALHDEAGRHTGYAKVTRDLTTAHDLEVQLRTSEERLRLLVGQVVDYAIIALDPQGQIETWNAGAQRLKGYTEAEAVGRSFAMFYPASDQRAGVPSQLLEDARVHGRIHSAGWRVRRDGSRFWADVTITALHDEDDNVTGFAKVTRDRTDVKRLEEAQDAFYASFSHDFRTPITVIKGFVDSLRDAGDDAQLRESMLDRIDAGADRLLSMVEGLVDFAQQRVAHADLQLADIDLAEVARRAVSALHPRIVEDRVDVEPDTIALARANGEAMTRVVTNLVTNALKYSPAGSPVAIRLGHQDGAVVLTVADQGRGIHPDDLPTIFEQFERGRYATDDGGSGLGLASVRDLVEQQGGTVEISSVVDEGTTITVSLPASLAPGDELGAVEDATVSQQRTGA